MNRASRVVALAVAPLIGGMAPASSPDGDRVVAASWARPATYFVDVEGFPDN